MLTPDDIRQRLFKARLDELQKINLEIIEAASGGEAPLEIRAELECQAGIIEHEMKNADGNVVTRIPEVSPN
jgi:hypothetical protein